MSFDFPTLVTDRTQADVAYAKQLIDKLVTGTATDAEKAEWNSFTLKGAYNHTDLNRVTAAMEDLKLRLEGYGYAVHGYQRIKVPHPVTGGGSNLPEGYTELAWIESTGTQYIDTWFKPTYKTRVVMDVSDIPATANYLFGVRNADSATASLQFGLYRNRATTIRADYFGKNASATVADTTKRTVIDMNGNVTTAYGLTVTNASVTSGTCDQNLYLFALNNMGSPSVYAKMRLYSCKIYDNGTLIRDYVPCKNSGGAFGLYDMVNGAFYQNAGTGAFTAGEEIAPPTDVPDIDAFDPYLWYEIDEPTPVTMTLYLLNVSAIRSVLELLQTTPEVPLDMDSLTVQDANAIEQILEDIDLLLTNTVKGWFYSGEVFSGEV